MGAGLNDDEASTRKIKAAQSHPLGMSPLEALVHLRTLQRVGNDDIHFQPPQKSRGRPKKISAQDPALARLAADGRRKDLRRRFIPPLTAQLERGLLEPPKHEAARRTRRAAGARLRDAIKQIAEKLRSEGVPAGSWVRLIVVDTESSGRHVRKVLHALGYRLDRQGKKKRISKSIGPPSRNRRKTKAKMPASE